MNPFSALPFRPAFSRLLRLLCAVILSLNSLPASALTSDRNQAVTFHSDSLERDEQKGTTTYSGNVVMQQGTMRINADKVVIFNDKNKVTKIIATGQPARFQQKPAEDQALVVAQAKTLEYNIRNETLHLIESASLQQEGTSLSGNRIDYDVRKSVVKAGGNKTEKERVRMVIPARSLKQTDE